MKGERDGGSCREMGRSVWQSGVEHGVSHTPLRLSLALMVHPLPYAHAEERTHTHTHIHTQTHTHTHTHTHAHTHTDSLSTNCIINGPGHLPKTGSHGSNVLSFHGYAHGYAHQTNTQLW